MNFEWKHGLIWITFELIYEGNIVIIDKCILDTGSAATAIDIDLVDFNYHKSATVKRLLGIWGGTQEVISQNVEKVTIDNKELNDIEIEFGDIQAELGINGFVGNDILSRFNILIDYQKREIQFMKAEGR